MKFLNATTPAESLAISRYNSLNSLYSMRFTPYDTIR
jgi:hypothetical protein